ncbi:hypothetical protein E1A91_A13G242300v1 [Gossypium mustelinum]|uniref:Uncharacterized protein n=1 Tax=Gossypium mustelinum TaxID=34275 RepID=A0A5D2WM42_GOSMU|nr:hypothetical protein E1A91_A13G242300v1 [Gossypium mustelinum]
MVGAPKSSLLFGDQKGTQGVNGAVDGRFGVGLIEEQTLGNVRAEGAHGGCGA